MTDGKRDKKNKKALCREGEIETETERIQIERITA